MTETEQATRRTKRRYAHELYPHAEEGVTRPLAVEVPYLYACAIGHEVSGTGWFDLTNPGGDAKVAWDRMVRLVDARRRALVADALLQGLTGDEAWTWADQRGWDESGEIAYERAEHYGVPVEQIKPYPCGVDPDHHNHYEAPDAHGWRYVNRVDGNESECPDCTEDAPEQDTTA